MDNNNKIKELEENIKYDIDRISDFIGHINLDEEIEITKTKILYLIYQNLKEINKRLNEIANKLDSYKNQK